MKYYKYDFNMGILNVLAIILFIIPVIPCSIYFGGFEINLITFCLMIIWFILHEIIHGIGFMTAKGVNFKNITFGALLEKGIFYCMCKQKINKKGILVSLILPFLTIGIITLGISFIIDNSTLAFLSCLNISGAVGDLVMFFMIIRMPSDVCYLDLDDPSGFLLLSNHDLSDYLLPGVTVVDTGNYSNEMVAHDFRKLVISKASIIGLVIMFLIFLFSFMIG